MFRALSALILSAFLAAGCSQPPPERVIEQQIHVFGTVVGLTYYGIDESQARAAGAEIERLFRRMHDDWHAWQKGRLTEINRAIAQGRPIAVDPSLVPLIEKSKQAAEASDGLFDPAIGRLVALWGFHASRMPTGPIPSAAEIRALVAQRPSMRDVELRDGVLRSRNRAVQLDFGGIAKGYAVELALRRLKELGVANAIVNAGGGLGVIGRHGDRPWRVGIRHPLGPGVLASLEVHDGEHVHTSGNYERFREWEGRRYSHVIDPRTGWPVEEVVSATVVHEDGALADAFTKPLLVGGTREWYTIAKKLRLKAVMLVDSAGTVYMDPAMARRVSFAEEPRRVVVSEPIG